MSDHFELAKTLSPEDQRLFEDTIARFEQAWHQTGQPNLGEFLPSDGPLRTALLSELIAIDIEFRQQRGESIDKAEYQRRFAEPKSGNISAANQSTVSLAQETVARKFVDTLKADHAEIPETFGRYRIVKALGQGAMGAVYLAHDQQLDRQVALKIPKFTAADSQEMLTRFYREARLAAALRHPNICPVFDVGEIDGRHYITMAFIEGRSLSEFVTGKRMQPLRHVAIVVRKLAIALGEAHARGVIHRDLKPANIMIDAKGEPVVMDFGLARRASNEEAQVTHSGAILGTPAYMSPEQAEGDQTQIGPAADVYSLGVILYELLTGQRPFQGSVMSILQQIGIGKPQPPSQRRADIDPVLEGICLRMMSRNQVDRHPSMKAVAQALTEYLKSTPGQTSQTSPLSTGLLALSEQSPQTDVDAATFLLPGGRSDVVAGLSNVSRFAKQPVAATAPTTVKNRGASKRAAAVATKPPDRQRPSRNRLIAGASVAGIVLLFATTLFFRVGNVDVKVVIDDPNLAVKFDGQTVTFEGSGSPIRLKPGEHKFIVERDGLEVETDQFTVKANGKHVLEVSVVDGRVVVRKDDQKPVVSSLVSKPNSSSSPQLGWHGWPADAPAPAIAPFDAEQAKQHQEAWAKYLNVPVEYTNTIGMKFRLIPPGEFMMGSTPTQIEEAISFAGVDEYVKEHTRSEAPQHRVILTQPIYLGIHEVTQRAYETVTGANPSWFVATRPGGKEAVIGHDTSTFPVDGVNWSEAAEFCTKLSEKERLKPFKVLAGTSEGNGYRIPTEAQWEFACKAGTTTKYWTGDTDHQLRQAAWIGSNAGRRTHAVGELKANPLGLYDIHGNVWEWVRDGWGPESYAEFVAKPAIDPTFPLAGGVQRVLRGGSWLGTPARCRASYRHADASTIRDWGLGFRVSLPIDAVKAAIANRENKPAIEETVWKGWSKVVPPPAIAPFDAEQAQQHQEAWAKHLGVPVKYTNSIGMKFRLIPPGEFTMGSTPAEIDVAFRSIDPRDKHWQESVKSEAPKHKVILTQPIYLGAHEVTQAVYEQMMGTNPSYFATTGMNKVLVDKVAEIDTTHHPVERVSWNDATEFCAMLSQREKYKPFYGRAGEIVTPLDGTGYRLPSEAEWEFACRGGTTTKYWIGDNDEELLHAGYVGSNSGGRTHAVGELMGNPFGLYDIHGNVWEWVQDGWEPTYYWQFQERPAVNPSIPFGTGSRRGLRGGHWFLGASFCRASGRLARDATLRYDYPGFRVALPVDALQAALANPVKK